jgi:hypothetical protein
MVTSFCYVGKPHTRNPSRHLPEPDYIDWQPQSSQSRGKEVEIAGMMTDQGINFLDGARMNGMVWDLPEPKGLRFRSSNRCFFL